MWQAINKPLPEIMGVWTPWCIEQPAESDRITLLYSVDSHEFMTLSQFEGAGRFRPSHWMRLKHSHVCIAGHVPVQEAGRPVIAYLPEYGYRVGTALGAGLLATAHATIGMVERWGELPVPPAEGTLSTQQVHHTKPTASTGQILAFVKGKWRSVFAAEFECISGFIGGATAWMPWMPVPRLGVWRAGCGMVPKGKRVIGVYGPDRGCRAYVGVWDGRYFTHEDTFNGPAICQAPIYWEPFPNAAPDYRVVPVRITKYCVQGPVFDKTPCALFSNREGAEHLARSLNELLSEKISKG